MPTGWPTERPCGGFGCPTRVEAGAVPCSAGVAGFDHYEPCVRGEFAWCGAVSSIAAAAVRFKPHPAVVFR